MATKYAPPVVASDWRGWVWPVPITNGRIPTVTDGFSHHAGYGPSGKKYRQHLGVDIMFPKRAGDPLGKVMHDASAQSIAPAGTMVLSAGPGTIWSSGIDSYGHWVKIDHGVVSPITGGVTTRYAHLKEFARKWSKGDRVEAGTILGEMGYAPALDSEQLRHLHFELAFPRPGVPENDWVADPLPYMRFWRKIPLPEMS